MKKNYFNIVIRPSWKKPEKKLNINLSRNVHFDQVLNNKIIDILNKKNHSLHYADPYNVYKSISKYYKISLSKLTIGFGATDLLYRITKTLNVKNFYILEPSFKMFEVYCRINNKKFKIIKNKDIFKKQRKNSAIYLVNPNGLDGSAYKIDKKIFKYYKYVIIDEVYADFFPKFSLLKFNKNNLIIVKSLSKSLGLAGLRVGFCKASIKITKKLQSVRLSQITSSYAEILVPKIIYQTKFTVRRMIESKKYIEKKYECKQSFSNYILFKKRNKLTKKFGSKKVLGYYRMALTNLKLIKINE